MNTHRYRARWIFPVAGEPVENGVVEIENGRITALHNRPDSRAVDLGNVAVLPGLINAHTHLEFSNLTTPLEPAEPFAAWVRALVAHRRSRVQDSSTIIVQGLAEAIRTGTRAIGEIATADWSPETFLAQVEPNQSCRVVTFRELLGLLPERIDEQLAIAQEHLTKAMPAEHPALVRGLSPHAPYSVHPELFHELVSLCRQHRAPLAMHLAETWAELELLAHGRGEFVELLTAFGVWRENLIPKGTRILDYLKPLADLDRALVIHGNYLTTEDVAFLAKHPQLTVVYCPRTHAYFGHENHPWPELLQAGVRVALGTDSRASNPDLNLWEEARFLRRQHPQIPPEQWLKWATQNGAIALDGPQTELGTLKEGGPAQFTMIPLAPRDSTDSYGLLFE